MRILDRVNDPRPTPVARPGVFLKHANPEKYAAQLAAYEQFVAADAAWLARHPDEATREAEQCAAHERERAARAAAEQERARRIAEENEAERQRLLAEREADPARCELSPLVGDGDAVFAALSRVDLTSAGDRSQRTCPVCSAVFVFERRGDAVYARCLAACTTGAIDVAIAGLVHEFEAQFEREAEERDRAEVEAKRAALAASCNFDDEDEQSDAPKWFVYGLIPSRRLTLWHGGEGTRKSFASTSASLAIASGKSEWCGLPVQPGKVLYVSLEMSPKDRRRYRRGLASGLGVDLAAVQGNLLRYPHALRLDDEGSVAQLEEMIAALSPDVVVIDSLSKTYAGGRGNAENDAAIMGPIMNTLERLTRDYPVAVVLLHHEAADGEPRGSSTIRAVPDHIVRVSCASKRDDAPITFTRGKTRVGGFDSMRVRLVGNNADDESLPLAFERVIDEPKESKPSGLTKRQAAIVKLVRANPSGLSGNAVAVQVGGSKNDVLADLETLKTDGALTRNDRGLWTVAEGT